jgi:hypothetical protein
VATVIPISDRRARLALILAVLGVPSLGITVPVAIWLGIGAVRQRRLSSGGEPAMGFIALVVAGLDVMTLNSVLLKTFVIIDPRQAWIGIGSGVALATAVAICTASTLRIHPERGCAPGREGGTHRGYGRGHRPLRATDHRHRLTRALLPLVA